MSGAVTAITRHDFRRIRERQPPKKIHHHWHSLTSLRWWPTMPPWRCVFN